MRQLRALFNAKIIIAYTRLFSSPLSYILILLLLDCITLRVSLMQKALVD